MREEQHTADQGSSAMPQEREPSSFKLIFTLGLAGFFSGLLLVGIYLLTLPSIEANKAEALRKAIYKVIPGCASFTPLKMKNGQLTEAGNDASGKKSKDEDFIYAGYDKQGKLLGFAIPNEEPGFQDLIVAIIGYDHFKQFIIGFEVLDSKETPGLGDKINFDEDFRANFRALSVDPQIVPVKHGKKQNPNEVETITGATISSKAVVRLLQKGIDKWRTPAEEFAAQNKTK